MARLRRRGALLGLLLLTGCGRGHVVPLWPSADRTLLPLVAGTRGASVTNQGEELIVSLAGASDRVVTRGGHQLSAASHPVLHLKARIDTSRNFDLLALAAPPGVPWRDAEVEHHALAKPRPSDPVDLFLPASVGGAATVDIMGFGLDPGPVRIVILEADIRPMSFLVRGRRLWQSVVALRGRPRNDDALMLLPVIAFLTLLGFVQRPLQRPLRRLQVLLIGLLLVVWSIEGIEAVFFKWHEVAYDVATWRGLSRKEQRESFMGIGAYRLAQRVDRLAGEYASVAFIPGTPDWPTWKFANVIAPRRIAPIKRYEPSSRLDVDLVAACAGTFRNEVQLIPLSPVSGNGPVRYLVKGRGGFSRELVVATEAKEPLDLEVRVAAPGGKTIWSGSCAGRGIAACYPVGKVVAGSTIALDGVQEGSIKQVQLFVLPDGFLPVVQSRDGNLVARPRGLRPAKVAPLLPAEEGYRSFGTIVRLCLALGLVLLVGYAALRLLGLHRLPGRPALAFLLGLFLLTLFLYLPAWIGYPSVLVALALATLFLAVSWRYGGRAKVVGVPPEEEPGGEYGREALAMDERVLLGVTLALFAMVLIQSWFVPIHEWDEMINWGYRGHLFYHEGATRQAVHYYAGLSPRHKAYPPGIPLVMALTGYAMGSWDDAAATTPFPLFYGAMIWLVYAGVRRTSSRRLALLAAALAASAPMALLMANLGMADLPLGAIFLAAFLLLERWDGTSGTSGYLVGAGLLCAMASFVKLDGGALKILLLAFALLRLVVAKTAWRRRLSAYAGLVAAAFLPILPWWQVYRSLGLVDWVVNQRTLRPGYLLGKLHLIPTVLKALVNYVSSTDWGGGPHYNLAFVVVGALLVASPSLLFQKRLWFPSLVLFFGVLGYCCIYIVSPQGLHQMERSLDRILLHFYPLAVVLAGRLLAAWRADGCDRRPPAASRR